MRLFMAIPLPEQIRSELLRGQEQLKSRRDRITWVRPENLHLTLRFLGECSEVQADECEDLLDRVAEAQAPLHLQLGDPGIFGSPERPRVLWMGVKGDLEALEQLVHRIEQALLDFAFPKAEQRFKAHLSLGRVKSCHPDLAANHLAYPPLPLSWTADSLQLIESRLKSDGPEYRVLTHHTLRASKHQNRG